MAAELDLKALRKRTHARDDDILVEAFGRFIRDQIRRVQECQECNGTGTHFDEISPVIQDGEIVEDGDEGWFKCPDCKQLRADLAKLAEEVL